MALGFTKVRIYHLLTWCMTLTHPEALILDPLQYGKEIWPRNFLPFCPASHNNPIHYTTLFEMLIEMVVRFKNCHRFGKLNN